MHSDSEIGLAGPELLEARRIGVAVDIETERYTLIGSQRPHLREGLARRGPERQGRRFTAYTDWEVHWSAGPESVEVRLLARVTVPTWRPPKSAPEQLVREWREFLKAVDSHERGHLELGARASARIHRLLSTMVAERRADAPRAHGAVRVELDATRRLETQYDFETDHGARRGVQW
jgi:predicted secreted Zn-dependent protease